MVGRLNKLSVERHFDAYADIDWDDPEFTLDPTDSRFELAAIDPLGRTDWYSSLSPADRAGLGCYRWAACMKTGWHFENLLQRGLLRHAFALPNGTPEFRYLHHEIIEESQHTLMFQEFVNRSGFPVRGMPWGLRKLAEWFVVPLARIFPTLFFLFVLGGEDPVDHIQRRVLSDTDTKLHPLVETDHADPHHRRGPPPLLRPALHAPHGAAARAAPPPAPGDHRPGRARDHGPAHAVASRRPRPPLRTCPATSSGPPTGAPRVASC